MASLFQSQVQGTVNRVKYYFQQKMLPARPALHDRPQRLAVLIDAENISYRIARGLFEEIAKYGLACVRRAYGDWTISHLKGWTHALPTYAITPVQQFQFTTGKNASDSTMIIEAMDLMFSHKLDAFCLVSSDSDFTRLAWRLREAGLKVYGFGQTKTPKPFVQACDRFIYTENLHQNGHVNGRSMAKPPQKKAAHGDTAELIQLIYQAIARTSRAGGWAHLGALGIVLRKLDPEFDYKKYNARNLNGLLRSLDLFELENRDNGQWYVRASNSQ
jgi:hypothetical protein